MASTKPYLIRAIHEWCTDQGFTPYMAVIVDAQTRVPREYVQDGQIVLNVGVDATGQLQLGNEEISFQARFNGVAFPVHVPVKAVAAIYARENGQGMAFEPDPGEMPPDGNAAGMADAATDTNPPEKQSPPGKDRPRLRRIK